MKRSPMKRKRDKPRPGRLQGEELEQLRQQCLERDNEQCVTCGKHVRDDLPEWHPDKYHMAHRRNKRMWGDSIDQVDTMCGACHGDSHNAGGKPCPKKPRPE